ncbi:hypothetical protein BpHYR1_005384 [Brachionus plicatilis]|uniref:Uncharacterized protein n=1 Tax=Brachionus plicatilis TaxID=10195 RepID=A0A3M7RGX0_BRAPC|nr:hypothetical protein BpHYR1_005384 [Brachionus plicatilis]
MSKTCSFCMKIHNAYHLKTRVRRRKKNLKIKKSKKIFIQEKFFFFSQKCKNFMLKFNSAEWATIFLKHRTPAK